jgi:adhesin transport system membrane fusion protein
MTVAEQDKQAQNKKAASTRAARAAAVEELDFMSESSAAVLRQSPRGGRLILWVTVAFFAALLFWASVAELDQITRGSGKVIPSLQVQVVQNLEGGILSEILVKEGEIVERDQVLLRIDDTRFSSTLSESRLRFLALKAKAARLQAEAENKSFIPPREAMQTHPELVEQELELFQSRGQELQAKLGILNQHVTQRQQELAELRSKVKHLKSSYWLANKELSITKPLVKEGAISEVEVLRLERQVNELRGQLETTKLAIPRVESMYNEAQRKAEEMEIAFRNAARMELNETVAELSGLSESHLAMEDRVRRTLVRAPVRGTVKQVMVSTIGGVIKPGMDLVEIVPAEDTLLVEARVRPGDIAFLHPGARAVVKFTAYDFAIYGGLDANVEHISADTITDEKGESYYLVRARTDASHFGPEAEPLPIIPGMTVNVDILTGKKTVLEYLLKPVLRAKELALKES